jgi:hypothetical protein
MDTYIITYKYNGKTYKTEIVSESKEYAIIFFNDWKNKYAVLISAEINRNKNISSNSFINKKAGYSHEPPAPN